MVTVPTFATSIRVSTAFTTLAGDWPVSTIWSLSSPMTSLSAIFKPSTSLARTARVTSMVWTWLNAWDMALALASRSALKSKAKRAAMPCGRLREGTTRTRLRLSSATCCAVMTSVALLGSSSTSLDATDSTAARMSSVEGLTVWPPPTTESTPRLSRIRRKPSPLATATRARCLVLAGRRMLSPCSRWCCEDMSSTLSRLSRALETLQGSAAHALENPLEEGREPDPAGVDHARLLEDGQLLGGPLDRGGGRGACGANDVGQVARFGGLRFRSRRGFSGHRQHGALGWFDHGPIGDVRPFAKRVGQPASVNRGPGADPDAEAAQDLGEDDTRVAARSHQRAMRRAFRCARKIGIVDIADVFDG